MQNQWRCYLLSIFKDYFDDYAKELKEGFSFDRQWKGKDKEEKAKPKAKKRDKEKSLTEEAEEKLWKLF